MQQAIGCEPVDEVCKTNGSKRIVNDQTRQVNAKVDEGEEDGGWRREVGCRVRQAVSRVISRFWNSKSSYW